jgi:hypothetical protein
MFGGQLSFREFESAGSLGQDMAGTDLASPVSKTRSPAYPPSSRRVFIPSARRKLNFCGHYHRANQSGHAVNNFAGAANLAAQNASTICFNMDSFPRTLAFRSKCPESGDDSRRRKLTM